MLSETASLIAMAPPPGGDGAQAPGPFYYVILMGLMMGIFYIILIRPQRRREKERKELINNVKTGDRILFAGGIIGTVSNVKDKTLTVRIAEKVKIEISRGAVSHVLEKDEAPPDPAGS